jgi:hypothetical protein
MTAQQNEELALALIEALNSRDLSKWSQKLSEDYHSCCEIIRSSCRAS